jgi:hypothetical protein
VSNRKTRSCCWIERQDQVAGDKDEIRSLESKRRSGHWRGRGDPNPVAEEEDNCADSLYPLLMYIQFLASKVSYKHQIMGNVFSGTHINELKTATEK